MSLLSALLVAELLLSSFVLGQDCSGELFRAVLRVRSKVRPRRELELFRKKTSSEESFMMTT